MIVIIIAYDCIGFARAHNLDFSSKIIFTAKLKIVFSVCVLNAAIIITIANFNRNLRLSRMTRIHIVRVFFFFSHESKMGVSDPFYESFGLFLRYFIKPSTALYRDFLCLGKIIESKFSTCDNLFYDD